MERVNQQVKREVGRIIQRELSDPRLEFVTVTEVEVRTMSRRASTAIAQSLITEGVSFRYAHSGGVVSGYIVITDPSEEQMMFLKRHCKFTTRRVDLSQTRLL